MFAHGWIDTCALKVRLHHNHHNQHTGVGVHRSALVLTVPETQVVAMSDHAGAAKWRRERRLRSWLRHERMTVAVDWGLSHVFYVKVDSVFTRGNLDIISCPLVSDSYLFGVFTSFNGSTADTFLASVQRLGHFTQISS